MYDAPSRAPASKASVLPIRTGFERFEFKYWVSEPVARQVVAFASPCLLSDTHSDGGIGQCNTSLYFDTPDLMFARHHVDQSPDRFKLRIRRYGDPPEGPGFFEIKRKAKWIILKKRAVVPWEHADSLLSGTYESLPDLAKPEERKNLEAFLYLLTVHGAQPKVYIRADREAYLGTDPLEDIRVTLDRNIVYQPADTWDFQVSSRKWIPIDRTAEHGEQGHRLMLELKFRGNAPAWMSDLVQQLALYRVGYSKCISALLRECRDFGGVPGWAPRRC
jgi:hypothetical protein